MDILDYLHWRSDLTFEERPLNEVDSLVFCALAYELFEEVFLQKQMMSLDELGELFFSLHDEEELKKRLTVSSRSYEILRAMMHTPRYGSLTVASYVNEIDHALDLQFSAMTLIHKGKWKAVVFRGTDDTITGWKEDFSMLYRKEVLAQTKAAAYMNEITKDNSLINRLFGKMDYYVMGHSKGGNLAMFACSSLSESVQKRIKRIDNFDGPGFKKEFWETGRMDSLLPVVKTYLPAGSFFGRMFENEGECVIVRSKKKGLLQHDPYNWQVDVDHFEGCDFLEESGTKAVVELNALIGEHSQQELEEIVESVFTLMDTLQVKKIEDFTKVDLTRALKALKELSELDTKTKKVLIELAVLLWDISF